MSEIERMKRPFLLALLAVGIGFVMIGGLIAAFGTGEDRPEGAAEHWLADVSDTTRKGVANDAKRRVEEDGDPAIAAALIGDHADKDEKSTFTAIEVGHARRTDASTALVPIWLGYRADGVDPFEGTLALTKTPDGWHVSALQPLDPALRVPSEGGRPVADASITLYAGAILVGLFVTVAASAIVRRAGHSDDTHLAHSSV